MLEIKNLCFTYGEKKIISDYNLSVKDGECICISGSSGSGKTTLLRLIAGLEAPNSGSVTSTGKISYVFQEDRLVPHMSILKNIMLCLPNDKKSFAFSLLKEAGLEAVKDKKPHELSGGMKRRAAIVRAVAFGGDILLLDEPFNGLDYAAKEKMAEMIKREYKGKAIILVSHIAEDAELLNAKKFQIA